MWRTEEDTQLIVTKSVKRKIIITARKCMQASKQ